MCSRVSNARATAENTVHDGVFRQKHLRHRSSVVEHTLGKGEVEGSIPFGGFGGVVDGVAQQLSWLLP